MEIKKYNDFSSEVHLEKRFDEIHDMFPDLETISDIFYSLDDLEATGIIPALYKSRGIFERKWCGTKVYMFSQRKHRSL